MHCVVCAGGAGESVSDGLLGGYNESGDREIVFCVVMQPFDF